MYLMSEVNLKSSNALIQNRKFRTEIYGFSSHKNKRLHCSKGYKKKNVKRIKLLNLYSKKIKNKINCRYG